MQLEVEDRVVWKEVEAVVEVGCGDWELAVEVRAGNGVQGQEEYCFGLLRSVGGGLEARVGSGEHLSSLEGLGDR